MDLSGPASPDSPPSRKLRHCHGLSILMGVLLGGLAGCGSSLTLPEDPRRSPLGSVDALPPVSGPAWTGSAWLPAVAPEDWPAFGRTADRRQHSPVDFASRDLVLLWKRRLAEHTYRYRRGTNIWSESPAVIRVNGRPLLVVGAYDKKVHAFDALTGKPLWSHTTGDEIVSSPTASSTTEAAVLAVASTDRVLYGLAPATGVKVWAHEAQAWSYTASPAVFASPAAYRVGGDGHVAAGMFLNDVGRGHRRQEGWAATWRLGDGAPGWKILLTTTKVWGPACGEVAGRPVMVFATADGTVQALDGRNGQVAWRFTTDERIRACPTLSPSKKGPVVLLPTSWGILWALDGATGKPRWSYKADLLAESSAAVTPLPDGRHVASYGAYDRCIHGVDVDSGRRLWRFETKEAVVASPASCLVDGRPSLFCPSLDDRIYGLDAETGRPFWSAPLGPLPWPFIRRGDAVFASPVVFGHEGRAHLVLPAHDGVIYCWTARPGAEKLP